MRGIVVPTRMAAPRMHISQWVIEREPESISGDSIMCFGEVASDMKSGNYYQTADLY
jgi:hypothetical protein